MTFMVFILLVLLAVLTVLGIFVWILSLQPDVKRASLWLTHVRFGIAILALIGLVYVSYYALVRTTRIALVCNPSTPVAEQACTPDDAEVTYMEDGMIGISPRGDSALSTGCMVNSYGNPWGGGEPCRDKTTNEPRIVVPGPHRYEWRWDLQ